MGSVTRPSFAHYLRHLRSASPAGRASKNGLLSRTQLAAGASVSVGYVIKLEQGRVGRPSPEVIDRIANTLGLSTVECRHLHDLAEYQSAKTPSDRKKLSEIHVTPSMKEAVDNLMPHLAAFVDEKFDILCCNKEYNRIHREISAVGNGLRWMFFTSESRSVMVEWEAEAAIAVASFRAFAVRRAHDPRFGELLNDLAESAEFCRLWERQEVRLGRHSPYLVIRDLDTGACRRLLAQTYCWPDPTHGMQLFLGLGT
jgi:transcriptional regulator with XRE-family HTH domain